MSIRTLLFFLAVVIVTGGMECQTVECPPDRPVLNKLTGLCEPEGVDDTIVPGGRTFPPGPGSGGLRTEPDTDTSTADDSDPDAVDLLIFGLNGRWLALDNGRLSCIQHFGTNMKSTLLEDRQCDHQNTDGSEITSFTSEDLDGMVSGDTITGTTVVCRYGYSDPSLNGIFKNPMTLTISADGKMLTGTYIFDTEVRDFSLVRQTVGDCQTEEQQLGDAFSRVQIPESQSINTGPGAGSR